MSATPAPSPSAQVTGSQRYVFHAAGSAFLFDADGPGVETAHGYTVGDVDALALRAARRSQWRFPLLAERHDLAFFAITEALLAANEDPGIDALLQLGERSISAFLEKKGSFKGVNINQRGEVPIGTVMPRFTRYWVSASEPTRSPEGPIIEAVALRQIWPRLTKSHKAVLIALATHDDYTQAAASLNKPYHSFVSTVSTARQQFMRLWHQYETPRPTWGHNRRRAKNSSHSVTVITIRRRERRRRARDQGALPRGSK